MLPQEDLLKDKSYTETKKYKRGTNMDSTYEGLKNTAKKAIDLKGLFESWYEAQKMCKEEKLIANLNKTNISLESFCIDGEIIIDEWNSKSKDSENQPKVLYILREENGSHSDEYDEDDNRIIGHFYKNKDDFWIKEQLCGTKTAKYEKLPPLIKKLVNVQYILEQMKTVDDSENYFRFDDESCKVNIGHMAFMNLNKLGGDSSVHWPTFKAYISCFKELIKREIEILNPDIIVCCGTYGTLKLEVYEDKDMQERETYKIKDKNCIIYNLPHPAARGIKIVEYGKKEILNPKNDIDVVLKEKIKEKLKAIKKRIDNNDEKFSIDVLRNLLEDLEGYGE